MTLEQVITAGQQFTEPSFIWLWADTKNWVTLLVIVFIFLMIVMSMGCPEDTFLINVVRSVIITVIIFFVFSIIFSSNEYKKKSDTYISQKKYWERAYANPYIAELSKYEVPILLLENDPQTRGTIAFSPKEKHVVYELEGQKKEELKYFDIILDLKKGEVPIIKGNYLTQDLGHGINKGLYNSVIHAPEGFDYNIE
ncbi:hypothetical protein PaeCFBP13512_18435 [Paenibacillus sp. CFBP13512]|uniref:hypothetical protein n=1 Tax=Paenibacillus sp. CFBP13512 TaxID=2184007 RepID=UPI0010C09D6C|nr:hypothetical protein [Paenibacillus sp. CFBP13512]TKJ87201.1 hypothetical protein PaeCFBP13512_18435 [Paenibacillus sp. CFBP13512]